MKSLRHMLLQVMGTFALLVASTAAGRTPAAPYLAVAAGQCSSGECGVSARRKSSAFRTTLKQKRVLNQLASILTPRGHVDGLWSVGDPWTLPLLHTAMEQVNAILDDLPPHFFQNASSMVHGPEMLLEDFFSTMELPRLKPPKRHVMPLVHHMYRLYRAAAKHQLVRNTTMRLVRDFSLTTHVDPVDFPVVKYGIVPLHTRMLLDSMDDLVFQRTMIEHGGGALFAFHPLPDSNSFREPFGLTVLGIVHHANTEIFVTKTLFVVSDAMRKASLPTCEVAMRALEAIEYRNVETGRSAAISIGDFRGLYYDDYGAASDIWRRLQADWDTNGPQQHIMKAVSHGLAEDVSIALLKTLLGTSAQSPAGRTNLVDLNEIILRWPYDARNPWHHLAIVQFPRYFELLAQAIKTQIREEEAAGETSRLLFRLQQSMLQRERFAKRTPLMVAAVLGPSAENPTVKAFMDLIRWSGLDLDILLNKMKDDYGNTAQMYLDGLGTFDKLAEDSELVTSAGYTKQVKRMWLGPTALNDDTWADDWENGGGWEQFPKRPDLDLPAGHVSSILEIQGLPSVAEFARLVNLRQPVVLRGAMKDLHVPRSLWSLENMRNQYGDKGAHVGLIPYLATFAAHMPGYANTSLLEYHTTMREYIDNFRRTGDGGDYDETTVPPYLFTSDFANDNPTIYEESIQGLEYLRNVTGLQHVTEGQFFVGEAATGAPVHWHNSAVNFLWYGRKRWVLFEPEEAFYSVKSSLTFFQEDLPDIISKERKVFTAANFDITPLEFVQEAGDIVILPDYWGHGTLNLEATVGIAFEFHTMANKMFQTSSDGYVAMNLGYQGAYGQLDEHYAGFGYNLKDYIEKNAPPSRPDDLQRRSSKNGDNRK